MPLAAGPPIMTPKITPSPSRLCKKEKKWAEEMEFLVCESKETIVETRERTNRESLGNFLRLSESNESAFWSFTGTFSLERENKVKEDQ